MNVTSSLINVGGALKRILCVNVKEQQESSESVCLNNIHHIQIIDRSGSMSGSLPDLIENVKRTFGFMNENDLVSVIWFSSPNQYKTVFRYSKPDSSLFPLLDQLKSTIGTTCFSDPFKEAKDLVEEIYSISKETPNITINFFTDGQPCIPWSIDEEISRVVGHINDIKGKVIAINTIGYGNYCDEKLLKQLSDMSEYGEFVHSSNINEYYDIVKGNYERVVDLCVESAKVEASDDKEIVYLSRKNTKFAKNEMMLSRLDRYKNQFIVISGDEHHFQIKVNDEILSTENANAVPTTTIANFLYAYAYALYNNGYRYEALNIYAKNLNDKFVVDEIQNVYTPEEVAAFVKPTNKMIFNKHLRYKDGTCGHDYLPKEDAVCVFDIIDALASDDNYYIPVKDYNRIGRKNTDNFNLFEAFENQEVKASFNDLVINEEFFNLSIRFKILGFVKLNPKAAKNADLPVTVDCEIFRHHTLIKDGCLNIKSFDAILTDKTLLKLKEICPDRIFENENTVSINLDGLPIINRVRINKCLSVDDLVNKVYGEQQFKAAQKVINFMIKDLETRLPRLEKQDEFKKFTVDQIAVLKEHGLSDKLVYVGVENVKTATADCDQYEAKKLVISMKGWASIPSVNEVVKRVSENKKLNSVQQVIYDFYEGTRSHCVTLSDKETHTELLSLQKKVRTDIRKLALEIFTTKFVKILTNDWFEGVSLNDKGEFMYEKSGTAFMFKSSKEIKYFN